MLEKVRARFVPGNTADLVSGADDYIGEVATWQMIGHQENTGEQMWMPTNGRLRRAPFIWAPAGDLVEIR